MANQYAPELFDHPLWFRRWDIHGPRSWQTCAVLGSPYHSEIIDENGEFTFDFLVAAQPLLKRWGFAPFASFTVYSTLLRRAVLQSRRSATLPPRL
jgi:hypothetical protein